MRSLVTQTIRRRSGMAILSGTHIMEALPATLGKVKLTTAAITLHAHPSNGRGHLGTWNNSTENIPG
jgi:hypothetical protein